MLKLKANRLLISGSIAALMCGSTVAAQAQPSTDQPAQAEEEEGEILVTGSRLREEAVQDVPVAVTVFDQESIEKLHAANITALSALAPNLMVAEQQTVPGVSAIFIRGFGSISSDVSIEPGITVYEDGVYQAVALGSLSQLFDVERIEVLRGPQSSLLGKNASAGAILVTRTRPSTQHFSAKVEAEYGSYNLAQVQGLVNAPVIEDRLAVKLYGIFRYRDSYITNINPGFSDFGGEKNWTIRGGLLFTPTDNLQLYVSAGYRKERNEQIAARNATPPTGLPCTAFGLCTNEADRVRVANVNLDAAPTTDDYHVTANLEWNLGPLKISSVSGYRHLDMLNQSDVDAGPFTLSHFYNSPFEIDSKSTELRISSVPGGGLDFGERLSWLIGAFYFDLDVSDAIPMATQASPAAPIVLTTQGQRSLRKTYAVFGQADYRLTDALSVSFGARASKDKVVHLFSLREPGTTNKPVLPYSQARTDSNTSIEGGVKYEFDRTKMVYFRYAEGYRGGGYVGRPASLLAASDGFGPETSRSFEVGAKTEFFDRKLLFNLALYSTTFKDLQRTAIVPLGSTNITITTNVAKARTRGFEVESILKPAPGLRVRGSLGYLDIEYLSYLDNGVDKRSTPFPFAPTWTANLTPSYEIRLDGAPFDTIGLQAAWNYKSGAYVSASLDANSYQEAFGTVDAQINLARGDFDLTFYVINLANKNYKVNGGTSGAAPTVMYINDNVGRLFGVSARKKF